MKVGELLRQVTWEDIYEEIMKDREKFPPRNDSSYKSVYEELLKLKPEGKLFGTLVFGIDDEENYSVMVNYPDDYDSWLYDIALADWKYVVGWEADIPEGKTPAWAICQVMYEITWYGFSQEEIRRKAGLDTPWDETSRVIRV